MDGLSVVGDSPDGPGLAELLHEAAMACFFNDLREQGTLYVERALQVARGIDGRQVLIEALNTSGSFGEVALDKKINWNPPGGGCPGPGGELRGQEARALNNLSLTSGFAMGDLHGSLANLQRAMSIAISMGDIGMQLFYGASAGGYALMSGNLRWFDENLPTLRALRNELDDLGTGGRNLQSTEGILAKMLGRLDEAREILRELLQYAREVSEPGYLYSAGVHLAELAVETGKHCGEADQALDDVLAIEVHYAGTVWPMALHSMINAQQGRPVETRERLDSAHAILAETIWALDQVWVAQAEAHLAAADGRWDEAFRAFETADKLQTQYGMRWDQPI